MLKRKIILGKAKKALALTLTSAMIASLSPNFVGGALKAQAADEQNRIAGTNLFRGISEIDDPSGAGGWQYLYFGKLKSKNLKYRILDKDSTKYRSSGKTIFIDCDNTLNSTYTDICFPYFDEHSYEWRFSNLYKWLNGRDFLNNDNCFTELERNAILPSTQEEGSIYMKDSGITHRCWALTGEKVFALSWNDVFPVTSESTTYKQYGYGNAEARKKRYYQNPDSTIAQHWHFRSRAYGTYVNPLEGVDEQGREWYESDTDYSNAGISPAMNLDPEQVILSYLISGYKDNAGAEWKLELWDNKMWVNVTDASSVNVTDTEMDLNVDYEIQGAGTPTHLGLLVYAGTADTGSLVYYQNVEYTGEEKGTVTFKNVNRGLMGSGYSIYLISERLNGGKNTDYASSPKAMEIKHVHNWTVTSNSTTKATISCSGSLKGETCGITKTITLDGPGKTYDGSEATARFSKSDSISSAISISDITYTKILNGKTIFLNGAPVNAGTYTASATVGDGTNTIRLQARVRIAQKPLSQDMVSVTPNSFTYDGKEKAPEVVVKDGNKVLKKDTDYTIDSSSIQKSTKASAPEGYTDGYPITVTGKGNYKNSVTGRWTIEKANPVVTKPVAKSLSENGSNQELVKSGSAKNGTIKYALGSNDKTAPASDKFSTAVPTGKAAGTYYVWYKVDGDANYTDVAAKCITVTISAKEEPAHKHTLVKTEAKAATATTAGNSAYWTCSGCNKYFADAAGTKEITKNSWIIPATGTVAKHTHKLVKTDAKAATATTPGNTAFWTCSDCGKFFSDAAGTKEITKNSWIIPATGADNKHNHKLVKTAAVAATATTAGHTEYYTCSDCGKFYSDAAGTKEIAKNSWIIPAKGTDNKHTHSLVKTEAKAATATTPGNTAFWTCAGCGKFFSDAAGTKEIAKNSWVIPAKGKNSKTPAAKGKTISNKSASYVVTSSSKKAPTVKYKAPKNSKATSVTIPDTVKISGVTYKVTEINAKAFKNKKIKKVKIGKYVTKIGNNAFYGCKYLTTVSGGAAVKSIGASAFYGCVKLKKAPIGAKVTSIGDKAFYDCKAMTTMVIPVNVNKLGALFAGKTPKLKTFTVKTKKLTKKNVKAKALTGMGSKNTVTTVPKGMGKTYKVLFQGKGLNKKIKIKQGK